MGMALLQSLFRLSTYATSPPSSRSGVRMRRKGHEVWAERLSYSGLLSEARALLMEARAKREGVMCCRCRVYFFSRKASTSFSIDDGPVAVEQGKSATSKRLSLCRNRRTRSVALDLGGVRVDEELLKVPLDASEAKDARRRRLQEPEDFVRIVAVDVALLGEREGHAVVDLKATRQGG
jgi:hypothetical protein